MKKIIPFLILFCLFLSAPVYGFDKWTTTDYIGEGAFLIALGVDWFQTKQIARDPTRKEGNKVLGPDPGQNEVDVYMVACASGHIFVAHILPRHFKIFNFDIYPRTLWQCFWIGVEAGVVVYNYNCGIRIRF